MTGDQTTTTPSHRPAKLIFAIGLLIEVTVLIGLTAYWSYLRLSQSRSLGFSLQIIAAMSVVAVLSLLAWLVWRLNRFRFSLRTMMIVFACIGVLLTVLIPRIRERIEFQNKLAEYLQAREVIWVHNGINQTSSPTGYIDGKKRWEIEEMVIPDPKLHHSALFTLQRMADEELAQLAQHPNLQGVTLIDCKFSEDGLLNLAKLKTLSVLDLRRQKIDEAWLEKFKKARPDCTVWH
jgi:hypothetical protein